MASHPMTSSGTNDLLELLRHDHLKIDELFGQYGNATDDAEKLRIIRRIYVELMPHTTAEEELFYPALRDAGSAEDHVEEAYNEHSAARKTLESILKGDPDDMTYDMKVKMLQKSIQHHVKEEETVLFQEARDCGLDLNALGQQVQKRKAELRPLTEQQMSSFDAGSTPLGSGSSR